MLCTQGVCRNDSLKFYYCLLLSIHDFEQLLFILFVVSYEHVIEFLNLLEIIHLHEHMHWFVNQRGSPHDRQIGKDMAYTWYAFSVPFQEKYTSRKGVKNMHTWDTLTRRVLESKGVNYIEERPSLEGHKAKGVI